MDARHRYGGGTARQPAGLQLRAVLRAGHFHLYLASRCTVDELCSGQLGILQPTYAQSYLYVAYRYLIGMGFDQEEKEALLALWDERLNPQADLWNPNASAAVKTWSDVRAQITAAGPPPPINVFKALEARNGCFITMST